MKKILRVLLEEKRKNEEDLRHYLQSYSDNVNIHNLLKENINRINQEIEKIIAEK